MQKWSSAHSRSIEHKTTKFWQFFNNFNNFSTIFDKKVTKMTQKWHKKHVFLQKWTWKFRIFQKFTQKISFPIIQKTSKVGRKSVENFRSSKPRNCNNCIFSTFLPPKNMILTGSFQINFLVHKIQIKKNTIFEKKTCSQRRFFALFWHFFALFDKLRNDGNRRKNTKKISEKKHKKKKNLQILAVIRSLVQMSLFHFCIFCTFWNIDSRRQFLEITHAKNWWKMWKKCVFNNCKIVKFSDLVVTSRTKKMRHFNKKKTQILSKKTFYRKSRP